MAQHLDQTGSILGSFGYFLLLIALLGVGVYLSYLIWQYLREERYTKNTIARSVNMTLLKILVPAEDKADTSKGYSEQGKKAAQLYASLYAIKDSVMHMGQWYPHGPHLSFEIVAQDGRISFYIAVPREIAAIVEKQLFTLYPDATIEEIERYTLFGEGRATSAAELTTGTVTSLPIKTHSSFDTDPLAHILSALTRLGNNEAAGIQILIRPTSNSWHDTARYTITQLQAGKKIGSEKSTTARITKEIGGFANEIARSALGSETTQSDRNSPLDPSAEQKIKAITEKSRYVGYETLIRIVAAADDIAVAKMHLSGIVSSFGIFNDPSSNYLKSSTKRTNTQIVEDYIFRAFPYRSDMILNTEELAALMHLPHSGLAIPSIEWLISRRASAPPGLPTSGLYLGMNVFRGVRTPIYIQEEDRKRHMYVIGKTGTGKSMLLEDMTLQDIRSGHGVCFIDPHGESIDRILPQIPRERAQDVILFDATDTKRPIGLNLLEYTRPEEKSLLVSELLNIFDKLYDLTKSGGPIFEQYFRNAAMLVMEDPASGSTLLEIQRVMSDADFRHYKLSRCNNTQVRDFWLKEAEKTSGEQSLANFVPYINSKMTPFLSNDLIRPIICQQQSSFNLREIMDNKKILLVKLPKGVIGETESHLLGMVLVTKIFQAAMSRADVPEKNRSTFYLYLDEFQNFTTKSVATILAEARKYGLALIAAHQYISQLPQTNDVNIRDAVFGNTGTAIAFRVGSEDADQLVKQYFDPVFTAHDLTNIEKYNAYIKLLVNNSSMRAFSLNLYRDLSGISSNHETAQIIKELSRMRYGRARDEIETDIRQRAML